MAPAAQLPTHRVVARNVEGTSILSPEQQARMDRALNRPGKPFANIHTDEVARKAGWRGAFVAGALIAADVHDRLIEGWGLEWLERGAFSIKHIRPTYDGDVIEIRFTSREEEAGLAVDFEVHGPTGELCHVGRASLPETAPAPPAVTAVGPHARETPIVAAPGELRVGDRLDSSETTLTRRHIERFFEVHQGSPKVYLDEGVGPLFLLDVLGSSPGSVTYPGLPVGFGSASQHFSLARVGDLLATDGRITRVWEKNGNHFYESESLMVANGARPVAILRRSVVYQTARSEAVR